MINEPARDELELPAVLHALSDPTRLAVVRQIAFEERLCGALRVQVAKSTLSQHLRVLRESGVTHTRPSGTQRWLSLRSSDLEARFPGLLDVVLEPQAVVPRQDRADAVNDGVVSESVVTDAVVTDGVVVTDGAGVTTQASLTEGVTV